MTIGHRLFIRSLAAKRMSELKPSVIFVLGGPGAGKGTVCGKIFKQYGYAHLSAGDLLREERNRPGSEFGNLIENHIKNGTIVPVKITCSLLDRAMKNTDSPNKRFLIDGFPRNEDNLSGWNEEMSDKVNLSGVFSFEVSEEVCTQRCLRRGASGSGRSDDNLESLKKRFATHMNDSVPIIEHYRKLGLVHSFNGEKTPEKVYDEVKEELTKLGW